ncbi:MAG: hypothetical protein KDA24_24710 [Deltaproteobacteria bacterium]|nr:hypothetical protein [Deltaproteobacteria bacterium]
MIRSTPKHEAFARRVLVAVAEEDIHAVNMLGLSAERSWEARELLLTLTDAVEVGGEEFAAETFRELIPKLNQWALKPGVHV